MRWEAGSKTCLVGCLKTRNWQLGGWERWLEADLQNDNFSSGNRFYKAHK